MLLSSENLCREMRHDRRGERVILASSAGWVTWGVGRVCRCDMCSLANSVCALGRGDLPQLRNRAPTHRRGVSGRPIRTFVASP